MDVSPHPLPAWTFRPLGCFAHFGRCAPGRVLVLASTPHVYGAKRPVATVILMSLTVPCRAATTSADISAGVDYEPAHRPTQCRPPTHAPDTSTDELAIKPQKQTRLNTVKSLIFGCPFAC